MIAGALNRNSALIKLDKETGSTIFSETYNNGGTDAFEHAVQTPNGIVAVGYVYAQDSNNTFYTEGQGYIMFLDDNANEISSINLNSYISKAYRIKYINNELIIAKYFFEEVQMKALNKIIFTLIIATSLSFAIDENNKANYDLATRFAYFSSLKETV